MITSSSLFPSTLPLAPCSTPDPVAALRCGPGHDRSPTFGSLLDPVDRVRDEPPGQLGFELISTHRRTESRCEVGLADADGGESGSNDEAPAAIPREDEDRARVGSDSASWIPTAMAGARLALAACPAFPQADFIRGEAVEQTVDPEVDSDATEPLRTRARLPARAFQLVDLGASQPPSTATACDRVLALAAGSGPHQGVEMPEIPGVDEPVPNSGAAVAAPAERAPRVEAPESPPEDRGEALRFEWARAPAFLRDRASFTTPVSTGSTEAAASREASEIPDTFEAAPMGGPTLPRSDAGASASAVRLVTADNRDGGRNVLDLDRAAELSRTLDGRGRSHPAAEFSGAQEDGESVAPLRERSIQLTEKNDTLVTDHKREAEVHDMVGIEAANKPAVMRSDSLTPSILSSTSGGSVPMLVGPGQLGEVRVLEGSAPWTAVGRVLDAADVLWATDRAGVDLKLEVGGEGIWVRVDYRDGEVTATFRSDSPELSDRLTAAWQQHVAGVSEQRPYRLSEPLFSINDDRTSGSSAHGSAAEGDAGRRGSSGREAADLSSSERISGTLPLAAARGSSPSEVNRLNNHGSRHRLSVFA